MPWNTPTLRQVREMVRDDITASLYGAAFIGNNVLRVVADCMAGLAHYVLRYLDWLALQLMPDTAETEWLDRHGNIWLTNADGTTGRKMATYAQGTVNIVGVGGTIIATATPMTCNGLDYETIEQVTLDDQIQTPVRSIAVDPGAAGNQEIGSTVQVSIITNAITSAEIADMSGGTDMETDDELRVRVLLRIRQPPMGGDATDYVQWALAYPGVTRAWVFPQEQGIGTSTVRFMMDDLRADNGGFPLPDDVDDVQAWVDTKRPVTVKQCYVVAPIPFPCDVKIKGLVPDTPNVTAGIEQSLLEMFFENAFPGGTIYAAWKAYAVQAAPDVQSFDLLDWSDNVMPAPGYMGTLGTITYTP